MGNSSAGMDWRTHKELGDTTGKMNDSVAKSASCISKGTGFTLQHLHDSSQPVIPIPGNLMLSSGLCRYQAHK